MSRQKDELIPFYTYNDLYLKPIYVVDIVVTLPKLHQPGQSVSNWEIRERLKRMLNSIQFSDFKVLESTLDEVRFVAVVNSMHDSRNVIKTLHGISFRAIGFSEPLSVSATKHTPDFPTRHEWDRFFAENREMNERKSGERPDTVYVGGLPFDWFKSSMDESYEKVIEKIFAEHGKVTMVDIPQCNPLRREMDPEISGIRQSVWSFGEDTFFEAYIQFAEYDGFQRAMNALGGKVLVRKGANGELCEAKLKVDFDRTAHLSARKIRERQLRRACIEYNAEYDCKNENQIVRDFATSTSNLAQPSTSSDQKNFKPRRENCFESREESARRKHLNDNNYCDSMAADSEVKQMALARQLIRAEKRRKADLRKSREHKLRKKLKQKLTERMNCTKFEREQGAKALLLYMAKLYEVRNAAVRQTSLTVNELASEYVKEQGLPPEEQLRQQLLRKREMKIRSTIARRVLNEKK